MGYTDILVLQAITGANDKQKFIKDHAGDENFRNFLFYALNPLLSYNLSEATLRKEDTSVPNTGYRPFKDIFECCEYLSRLRGLDDATVRQIKMFLYATPEDARELYHLSRYQRDSLLRRAKLRQANRTARARAKNQHLYPTKLRPRAE